MITLVRMGDGYAYQDVPAGGLDDVAIATFLCQYHPMRHSSAPVVVAAPAALPAVPVLPDAGKPAAADIWHLIELTARSSRS